MALIKCPECGNDISDSAEICPNCGYNIKSYYKKIKLDQQRTTIIKIFSIFKKKKILMFIALIISVILIIFLIYRLNNKEVIHDISWGMSVSDVEKKEKSFSGADGYYNEENNYYGVSNVDFFGENATLLYNFEENKLASITAITTSDTYKEAYNVAYNICKEYNLPVSFTDRTDNQYRKSSALTWNIDGTTINLVGNYESPNYRTYTFLMSPYDGNEFGEIYEEKGICSVGSKTLSHACKNEISPWNTDGHCYEHGCYVIGCPNGIYPLHDYNTILCNKHFFLSDYSSYN